MKKFKISFIILETISMLVLILFVYYVNFHINNIEKSPFGLDKNYIKISARFLQYPDENKMDEFNLKIKEILHNHKSTVILDNLEAQGLGLYDTNYFYSHSISEGEYFYKDEFLENTNNILVNKNSFVYNHSLKNNNKYYSNNNIFNVKGILSPSSELLNTNHSFIYSLLNTRNFNGDYYLNYSDLDLANELYDFFQKNSFQTEFYEFKKDDMSFLNIFLLVNSQKFVPLMEMGVLFVYFNIFLYFIYYLFKERKNISIRKLVGASNNRIYISLSKIILINSIIGTSISLIIYNLIFKILDYQDTVFTSLYSILLSSFIHISLTFLIFSLTFYSTKNSIYGGYSKV